MSNEPNRIETSKKQDTQKKQRIAVQGLRRSAPDILPVLTQEVLRAPLGRVDPATLCDLLALSELESGLGISLTRDLRHFRDQMFREISDLPDSPVLAEFAVELAAVGASQAPACLRAAIAALTPTRKHTEAVAALTDLQARWEGVEPEPVVLRIAPPKKPASGPAAAAPAPRREVVPTREKLPPATAVDRKPRTPAAQVDERRVTWIEEEVMNRLEQYGVNGLKEAVLVAGARHRSPWKDMTEEEVLAVLRRLRRENRVRLTASRWSTVSSR